MTKADSFDKNVDKYDSWFDRNRPAYESELEAIRTLLPRLGKGLEIGAGTGRFAARLGVFLGIDPSPPMGKVAIERGIKVVLGVGENLPCKDSCVDFALLVTTICFLDDVPRTLGEVYRVLREGGSLLIGFIDRESYLGATYARCKEESSFYREATFLSADEVTSHLKQAGFRDFVFRQTLFTNPAEMKEADPVKPGYGEGSFVVVRGEKPLRQKRK